MKEICIPIPHFGEQQIAEVVVTVNGERKKFNFRVESFHWGTRNENGEEIEAVDTTEKIENLRKSIESYDDGWKLVQILTPTPEAEYIQVLFRQKQ